MKLPNFQTSKLWVILFFLGSSLSLFSQQCGCPVGGILIGADINSVTDIQNTMIPPITTQSEIICIEGILRITRDQAFLDGTEIFLSVGASIEVMSGKSLTSNFTRYFPCTGNMAQGIIVNTNAYLHFNDNIISDAHRGLDIRPGAIINSIVNNTFDKNYTGIYFRSGQATKTKRIIRNNKFISTGTLLNLVQWSNSGILVDNQTVIIHNNYFDLLSVGIIAGRKATVDIQNNIFKNIFRYTSTMDDPNFTSPASGYGIDLTGNATATNIKSNDFTEMRVGIRSFNSTLMNVENNTMDSLSVGVYELNAIQSSKIHLNKITFQRHGLWISNPVAGMPPKLIDNEISSDVITYYLDQRNAIFLDGVNGGLNKVVGIVHLNKFHIDGACFGLYIRDCANLAVESNTVRFSKKEPALLIGTRAMGISIEGTNDCFFFDNKILTSTNSYDEDYIPTAGILAVSSRSNIYCCNQVAYARECYKFQSNCDKTQWRNNRNIGTYVRGLAIDINGWFGPQPDINLTSLMPVGNLWTGSILQGSGGSQVRNNNSASPALLRRSLIYATGCSMPNWPSTILPIQPCDNSSTNWFETHIDPSKNCLTNLDPFCDSPIQTNVNHFELTPYISDTDKEVAIDGFDQIDYRDRIIWDGSRTLYNLLKENSNLLGQNSSVDSFYIANNESIINNFYNVDNLLFNESSELLLIYNNILSLNQELLNKVKIIDSLEVELNNALNSQDSLVIINAIDETISLIDINRTNYQNEISDYQSNLDNLILQIHSIINNIPSQIGFCDNEKFIWSKYVDIILNHVLTVPIIDSIKLADIAYQCPDVGGQIVFTARNLFSVLYGQNIDNEISCNYTNSQQLISKSEFYQSDIISINPNPTKDNLVISLEKMIPLEARFELFTLTGKTPIISDEIRQTNNIVELVGIPSGIYIAIIKNENRILKIQKIIVLR